MTDRARVDTHSIYRTKELEGRRCAACLEVFRPDDDIVEEAAPEWFNVLMPVHRKCQTQEPKL